MKWTRRSVLRFPERNGLPDIAKTNVAGDSDSVYQNLAVQERGKVLQTKSMGPAASALASAAHPAHDDAPRVK